MKSIVTLRTILTWLAIVAPFAYLAVLWPQLPNQVPTHFNAAGEIDTYGSKYVTMLLAGLPLLTYLIRVVVPRLDPKSKLHAASENYQKLMMSLAIGLSAISSVLLYATYHQRLPTHVLELAICLLLVLMGNYLTTLKPNYFIGVRTPWTLESESVWAKTHRLVGRLLFGGGLLAMGAVLFVPSEIGLWVIVGLAVGVALVGYLYSYMAYRRESRKATSVQ